MVRAAVPRLCQIARRAERTPGHGRLTSASDLRPQLAQLTGQIADRPLELVVAWRQIEADLARQSVVRDVGLVTIASALDQHILGNCVRRCLLVPHVEPVETQRRWNSNLHAFEVLLEAVPPDAQRGLDVGCGEGETARRLRTRVASVVGLDRDEACVAEARRHGGDISYILGELEHVHLPENGFDVVTAVAVLHQMDQQAALCHLARLVAPGGVLLIVGLAKSRRVTDYAYDIRDAIAVRRHTLTKEVWHTPAPTVWPPPLSWADTRRASLGVLPAASFRRVPYFRYGLTWVKPESLEAA